MNQNLTKWMSTGLATLALFAGTAFADSSEVKATTDTSRNPITGTVTVKKKYKNKRVNATGTKVLKQTASTKKYKTDGSTESKKTTATSEKSGE